MLKAIEGLIKLIKETHTYKVEDTVLDNQVSVTSLIRGGVELEINDHLRKILDHGTDVHAEISKILSHSDVYEAVSEVVDHSTYDCEPVMPETEAIIKSLHYHVLTSYNNEGSKDFMQDVCCGMTWTNDNDKESGNANPLHIFGTPDLVLYIDGCDLRIYEFKSSRKVSAMHKKQVTFYRMMTALTLAACPYNKEYTVEQIFNMTPGTIISTEEIVECDETYEEALASINEMIEFFLCMQNIVPIEDKHDAECIHSKIQIAKGVLKTLEAKLDAIIDENVPEDAGKYGVGNLIITRSKYETTVYDKELIKETCPGAISTKEVKRTFIKVVH